MNILIFSSTTGKGYYAYIETSSPRKKGDKGKLLYNYI